MKRGNKKKTKQSEVRRHSVCLAAPPLVQSGPALHGAEKLPAVVGSWAPGNTGTSPHRRPPSQPVPPVIKNNLVGSDQHVPQGALGSPGLRSQGGKEASRDGADRSPMVALSL